MAYIHDICELAYGEMVLCAGEYIVISGKSHGNYSSCISEFLYCTNRQYYAMKQSG